MVQSKPPDPVRADAGVDEVPNRLVKRRGLTDAARTEHELETVRVVAVERLPQLLGQGPFYVSGECGRYDTGPLPRVLLVEHTLQVFWVGVASSQRSAPSDAYSEDKQLQVNDDAQTTKEGPPR